MIDDAIEVCLDRYLVDTQVLLWYFSDSPKLSERSRNLLTHSGSVLYFSIKSRREIAIKHMLGRPDFAYEPEAIYRARKALRWIELPTKAEHIFALDRFSDAHRDPFDRLLLAQAHVEGLTLLTSDGQVLQYATLALDAG